MSGSYPQPQLEINAAGVTRIPVAGSSKKESSVKNDGVIVQGRGARMLDELYRQVRHPYHIPDSPMDWESARDEEIVRYGTKIFENLEKNRLKRRVVGRSAKSILAEGQTLREQNWKNMLLDLQRGTSVLGEMSFTSRLLFDRTVKIKPIYGN